MYVCMYIHTYIIIYTMCADFQRKGKILLRGVLRGVGTLRYLFPPNASVRWQPDGLTIHTKKWFLGARFLGAPPFFLA